MAATQVRATQILDGTIQQQDLDISTSGKAVVAKLAQGGGIALASTGVDVGTGVVTVALDTSGGNPISTFYIGTKARFIALANGLRLEVFDGTTWQKQIEWTE